MPCHAHLRFKVVLTRCEKVLGDTLTGFGTMSYMYILYVIIYRSYVTLLYIYIYDIYIYVVYVSCLPGSPVDSCRAGKRMGRIFA